MSTSTVYSVGHIQQLVIDRERNGLPYDHFLNFGLNLSYDPTCDGSCYAFAVDIFYPIELNHSQKDTNNFWGISSDIWKSNNITVGVENAQVVNNGQFPLIIWSNDNGTPNVLYLDLFTSWVQRGFIVAAVHYHASDTPLIDSNTYRYKDIYEKMVSQERYMSYCDRVTDMKKVIDLIEVLNDDKNHILHNHVLMDQICASGHGTGGLIAYLLAIRETESSFFYQHKTFDTRVKAIITLDGEAFHLSFSTLQQLNVPMMQFSSNASRLLIGIDRAYAASQLVEKYNIFIHRNSITEHFKSNICNIKNVFIDLDTNINYDDFLNYYSVRCQQPSLQIQPEEMNNIVVSMTTPFLSAHLSNIWSMNIFLFEKFVYFIQSNNFNYIAHTNDGDTFYSVDKALELMHPNYAKFVSKLNNKNNTLPFNLNAPAFKFYTKQPHFFLFSIFSVFMFLSCITLFLSVFTHMKKFIK